MTNILKSLWDIIKSILFVMGAAYLVGLVSRVLVLFFRAGWGVFS